MQRPLPKGDFNSLVIPVKRVGNLIIVEATVDGLKGNFILDTGAPYLVLNATYFRDYQEVFDQVATDVNGNQLPQKVARVEKLKLSELYYEYLDADVSDLSAIENKRGIKILGLLGVNLFMRMEMELDLQNQQLTFRKVDRQGRCLEDREDALPKGFNLAFELRNNAIIAPGKINEEPLRFCFDTGAEALLLDNKLPAAVYEKLRVSRRTTLLGAGGKETEVLLAYLQEAELGVKFGGCSAVIADLDLIGAAYGSRVDAFVGYDILRQGKVSINFIKKELTINPFQE